MKEVESYNASTTLSRQIEELTSLVRTLIETNSSCNIEEVDRNA